MDDRICEEKHKRIDEKLETHENRLNNHGDRLDVLEVKTEKYQSKTEIQIVNLCEQIKSLVTTIRWFMGLMIGTLLGFFIWYIQTLGKVIK